MNFLIDFDWDQYNFARMREVMPQHLLPQACITFASLSLPIDFFRFSIVLSHHAAFSILLNLRYTSGLSIGFLTSFRLVSASNARANLPILPVVGNFFLDMIITPACFKLPNYNKYVS